MKTPKDPRTILKIFVLIAVTMLAGAAVFSQTPGINIEDQDLTEVDYQPEILWEIKAYKIFEKLLDVKAIDKNGEMHDVKAIQNSDDVSILEVKAMIGGERLPIKLIIKNNERYYPVKAIDNDGNLIDIKAVTEDGEILPIKGVSKSGNIVHLRAIRDDQTFYNIIAMSPDTEFNHVKGVKMTDNPVEAIVNGVSIFAHVKSLK